MISSLRGTVLAASGSTLVIDVGGVGFAVQVPPALSLASRVGEEALVHTSLIVREDALTLFGFAAAEELEVFELLIGVTGVGPKSALGVLSAMSPEQVAAAVDAEDDAAFRRVSGIGPKTAKLIVLSLAGKLVVAAAGGEPEVRAAASDDVLAALTGLGWPERVARQTIDELVAESEAARTASVQGLLRMTLGRLGQGGKAAS
ncbi:Holliday junction branch migration protein RuvA [Agromyces archimandritae]|uniref:Holliday junction branch migration complex subunit RuvA n=1 Tax=Agromyces archimandritae TaxID=2781962 RepID=A0A975FMU3_9MICO|nr:Holliday junction branch migration protein RuvA [Agromyces archimandritae]QTX04592.1 Holliday junction branch migration protein RuvA [Agromyces archimandritae]